MAEMSPEPIPISGAGERSDDVGATHARAYPELYEAATVGPPSFKHLVQTRRLMEQPHAEGDIEAAEWLLPRVRERFAADHGGIAKEYYCQHVVGGCLLGEDATLHSILNSASADHVNLEIECKILVREAGLGFAASGLEPQLHEAVDHAYSALTRVLASANSFADPDASEQEKAQALTTASQEVATARGRVGALLQRQARYEYFLGVLTGVLPMLLIICLLGLVSTRRWDEVISAPHLVGAMTMATLGSVISVVQRMSSGDLVVDFTAPRGQRVALGALRPVVGAVFGAVAYFATVTGILASGAEAENGSSSFALFAFLGFAAGFSERFATDMIERAGQLIGSRPSTTADNR
ncbi:hypothetical protein [Nocardioides caldifontis]|uniref:hypothetical protein n=1 Tax=Nocardioides caldifontis TaxID=2588938 RepID=UPI0011DFD4D9|nr:hypothetical protein [Nocardioides caldifontis]